MTQSIPVLSILHSFGDYSLIRRSEESQHVHILPEVVPTEAAVGKSEFHLVSAHVNICSRMKCKPIARWLCISCSAFFKAWKLNGKAKRSHIVPTQDINLMVHSVWNQVAERKQLITNRMDLAIPPSKVWIRSYSCLWVMLKHEMSPLKPVFGPSIVGNCRKTVVQHAGLCGGWPTPIQIEMAH